MRKKGQIWISAVIYIMIAVVIMVLVLEAGIPVLSGLREKSAFTTIRDTLTGLDRQIIQIAGEGQGSQRVLPLDVVDGSVSIESGKLRWKLETDQKVIEPKSRIELGNLIISSDIDVSAEQHGNYFILQNSRIKANISKLGSAQNWTDINTSKLINNIEFLDTGDITTGTFKFTVNNSENSANGTGYTELQKSGTGLTTAKVIAHINSTLFSYNLEIALESKADFLRTKVTNFKRK